MIIKKRPFSSKISKAMLFTKPILKSRKTTFNQIPNSLTPTYKSAYIQPKTLLLDNKECQTPSFSNEEEDLTTNKCEIFFTSHRKSIEKEINYIFKFPQRNNYAIQTESPTESKSVHFKDLIMEAKRKRSTSPSLHLGVPISISKLKINPKIPIFPTNKIYDDQKKKKILINLVNPKNFQDGLEKNTIRPSCSRKKKFKDIRIKDTQPIRYSKIKYPVRSATPIKIHHLTLEIAAKYDPSKYYSVIPSPIRELNV
jgi:hypothetical protein